VRIGIDGRRIHIPDHWRKSAACSHRRNRMRAITRTGIGTGLLFHKVERALIWARRGIRCSSYLIASISALQLVDPRIGTPWPAAGGMRRCPGSSRKQDARARASGSFVIDEAPVRSRGPLSPCRQAHMTAIVHEGAARHHSASAAGSSAISSGRPGRLRARP